MMKLNHVYVLLLLIGIQSDRVWQEMYKEIGTPEIFIGASHLSEGKTYFKNLDKIRSNCTPRKIKITHHDRFENCEDAKQKALNDSKKGGLRIISFNGFFGKKPTKYELYKELLGVEVINTGCMIYNWDSCYNKMIENEMRQKYDKDILTLISKYEELIGKDYYIDIEKGEFIKFDRVPQLGELGKSLKEELKLVKCSNSIIYMEFKVEILKNSQTGRVKFIRGDGDRNCRKMVRETLEEYKSWDVGEEDGRPISTIVEMGLFF